MAFLYKKPTSPAIELSDCTKLEILGEEILLSDVVLYRHHFQWVGRVVKLTQNYAILMDWEGRLCRVVTSYGEWYLLGRNQPDCKWSSCYEAESVYTITKALLRYKLVKRAITLANRAEYDACDYDRWMIPLVLIASSNEQEPLSAKAAMYYGWPARTRRTLEATLEMMRGFRQQEVFIRNILGGIPTIEIRDQYGLRDAAIRTARWRARAFLRQTLPHYSF